MKKLVLLAAICVCLVAPTALGATACVDWSCIMGVCDFDASCSSASPFIWKYAYDFGDGNGTVTGSSTLQYTYPHFPSGPWTVPGQMTIIYWSEPTETSVSCNFQIGYTAGPQAPLTGRCSFSD